MQVAQTPRPKSATIPSLWCEQREAVRAGGYRQESQKTAALFQGLGCMAERNP